jgi:hypothetical protein
VETVPTLGLSDHVTAVLLVPATVAVNCCVWPLLVRVAVGGATETVTGMSVTTAEPDAVGSPTLVAVTVTVWLLEIGFGAV